MRTVLALAITAALTGCIPESTDETGADAGLATTTEELATLCSTAVTFTNVTQPNVATLVRGGLSYVSGTFNDVEVTLPACPWVSGVTVDGAALGTAPGIDNPSYYQIVSDVPVSGGHRVKVRLWLANAQTGARKDVKIWANNSMRDGARALSIAWVGVAGVNRASKVSMPAEQVKSSFASAAYAQFGDDGWDRDDSGAKTWLHGFDYGALSVTIDDSIRFHASQRYRVYSTPFACDVIVTVDGRFRLSSVPDPEQPARRKFQVDWIKPSPSHPLPFLLTVSETNGCTAGVATFLGGLVGVIDSIAIGIAQDSVGSSIAGGIGCGLSFAGLGCADLISGFEYAPGELRAVIDATAFQVDNGVSVTVKAPYVVSAAGVAGGQLVLPAGETVLVTTEGLATACGIDTGNPTTCNGGVTRKVGGAGLFNLADPATWPVPDPYQYGTPPLPQREQALAAHVGLNRAPSALPASAHFAGALLARYGASRSDVGSPCLVHADVAPGAPPVTLALGRNDRALNGTPYGTGTALVTARFTINAATNCASYPGLSAPPPNPN